MAAEDDWVSEAMKDDALVADLLVRLKEPRAAAPVKAAAATAEKALVLPTWQWGVRKRRMQLAFRCKAAPKGADSRRNSPMTPLSWSAGTASSSGTADCFEESNMPACGSSRSKVTTTATDSTSAHEGKLKRKKTFAELKEEESLLLKERVHLKRKLATLNAMLEKERTMNQTLKRMKLSLNTTKRKQTGKATGSGTPVPSMDKLMMSSTGEEDKSLTLLPQAAVRNYTTSDVPREPSPVEKRDTYCFLPDLNLMPSEADLCW